MDIREFRIGNWIRHENENGVFDLQVVSVHDGAVDVKYNGGTWALSADVIAPIPLTEELLLKCGFEYLGEFSDHHGDVTIHKYKCGCIDVIDTDTSWGKRLRDDYRFTLHPCQRKIRHLHQLQNLYFAITSEELEIKL